MLRAILNITFSKAVDEDLTFNFCNSIETDESYENLTDTAKIILPYKLSMKGLDIFTGSNPVFKRGDRVSISTGYYPNLVNIFNGYIRHVGTNTPIEIDCEDEMYLLKQYTVTYPSKTSSIYLGKNGRHLKRPKTISENITLQQLMDNIIADDIDFKVIDDIALGQFRVSNATPAMVLDKLKSEYGLFSYFKNGILQVGFANNASETNEATLEMEKQVINSEELEYQIEDEIKIKCKAVSIMPDNTKIEIEVGDEDGEQKTLHKYNLNETDLRTVAQKWINEFKYTGFKGDLETLGEPYFKHGDRVKIVSKKLPERNGTYLIKRVKRKLTPSGGVRQIFTLGVKVA